MVQGLGMPVEGYQKTPHFWVLASDLGSGYNIPNQEYIEQGLFELKKTVHDENGVMVSKVTTKVTGKGQQYFINKFVNNYFTL